MWTTDLLQADPKDKSIYPTVLISFPGHKSPREMIAIQPENSSSELQEAYTPIQATTHK